MTPLVTLVFIHILLLHVKQSAYTSMPPISLFFLYSPMVGGRYAQFPTFTLEDLCCEVEAFDEAEERCDCPPRCETIDQTRTISYSTNGNKATNSVGVNVFYESLIIETKRLLTHIQYVD